METERVAILLTGVGKRYDIVSAFARHAFVIAADPSPLAPAQYAADVRVAPTVLSSLLTGLRQPAAKWTTSPSSAEPSRRVL